MSDDNAKLLARLAALESELATLRAAPKAADSIDPKKLREALNRDPFGTLTKLGANLEHITKVAVANTLGDHAPPELRMLAAMGPQLSETSALKSELEEVRRQLSSIVDARTSEGTRQSFQSLARDKSKYPHLSKAYTADASLFEDELAGYKGNAEDLAKKLEERHAKLAVALGAPPASEKADDASAQSTQSNPAIAGAPPGEVPPIPKTSAGVFSVDEHQKLRDEIVRKYAK